MKLWVSGEERRFEAAALDVAGLVEALGLDGRKVAVKERNLEIVPRSTYTVTSLTEGDRIEIVHFHRRRLT